MTVAEFIDKVRSVCQAHHGSVISWGRSTLHNVRVSGHETSLHLSFLAADVVFDEMSDVGPGRVLASRLGLHWKMNDAKAVHFQALPLVQD